MGPRRAVRADRRCDHNGTICTVARETVTISDAPLSRLELQEAAVVAARAFHADPFFVHLTPAALLRARGLALFFATTCRNLGPKGTVTTARVDGRIVGVAARVAPGGYPYPATAQVGQMVGALRALLPRPPALVEGIRYLLAIEKAHPKEPTWYLQLLACDPAFQRQGIGTELQASMLAACDDEGVVGYLETQNEDNLAYYRRFGYELADVLRPVKSGPPLWTMRREPRGAAS